MRNMFIKAAWRNNIPEYAAKAFRPGNALAKTCSWKKALGQFLGLGNIPCFTIVTHEPAPIFATEDLTDASSRSTR